MRSLLFLLITHPIPILACMHYTATFPTSLSSSSSFSALIIDNDVPVCWISQTYQEHEIVQGIWQKGLGRGGWLEVKGTEGMNRREEGRRGKKRAKRSGWDRISLTGMDPLRADRERWSSNEVQNSIQDWYLPSSISSVNKFPGSRKHLSAPHPVKEDQKDEKEEADKNTKEKEQEQQKPTSLTDEERSIQREQKALAGETWLEWRLHCQSGYYAHVMPGFRSVLYHAHGQEFWFVPKEREEIGNETGEGRWVYEIDLWCENEGMRKEEKAKDEIKRARV